MLFTYLLMVFALPFYNHTNAIDILYDTAVSTTYTSTYSTTYTSTTIEPYTDLPIVVLHGVASNAENMAPFSQWLEDEFSRKVYNIEIGNGKKTSLFTPMFNQLYDLCENIYSIPALQDGFDFIGMSQGGLLARGYVERCNKYPVRNLINLVAPNGGVFLEMEMDVAMYSQFYQDHLSISGYWRDPAELEDYLEKCSYLPFINNEVITGYSPLYKQNIQGLKNYVVVWSPNDEVLNPPESAMFSVLDEDHNVIPWEETDLYLEDLLGLRTLLEQERFSIHETNCSHVEHRNPVCFGQLYDILKHYL
jgi:palmitoyl-protein thioesterase